MKKKTLKDLVKKWSVKTIINHIVIISQIYVPADQHRIKVIRTIINELNRRIRKS